MRRTIMVTMVFFSISLCGAVEVFSGPICMRGKADGDSFKSSHFSIKSKGGEFVISCDQKKGDFVFKTDARVLEDAIISRNKGAVAVSLGRSNQWGDSHAVLATIGASGETRVYEYKDQRMTERFGWVIELGSVSDDGKFILAKCATLLPEENGVQMVNHRWAILAIGDGSLKVLDVLELEAVLTKWAEYTKPTTEEKR